MIISNIFAEFRYGTKNPKKALKLKHGLFWVRSWDQENPNPS